MSTAVSVIIPTWNGWPLLSRCLRSLEKLGYRDFEVFVVDNGSIDQTAENLQSQFPDVRLIRNTSNLGFGEACNIGARESRGKYLWFLNNDTEADPRALGQLTQTLDESPDVGLAQSKTVLLEDPSQIDSLGAYLTPLGFLKHVGLGEPDSEDLPKMEIFSPKGTSMLVRRSAFMEAGGFEPMFWLYFEESDLAWRLLLLGYRVVCEPSSKVLHVSGASSGRLDFSLVQENAIRNRLITLFSNLGPLLLFPILSAHLVALLSLGLVAVLMGRRKEGRSIARAIRWCWIHRDQIRRRRRHIQTNIRRVPDRFLFPKYMRFVDFSWAVGAVKWFIGSDRPWGPTE